MGVNRRTPGRRRTVHHARRRASRLRSMSGKARRAVTAPLGVRAAVAVARRTYASRSSTPTGLRLGARRPRRQRSSQDAALTMVQWACGRAGVRAPHRFGVTVRLWGLGGAAWGWTASTATHAPPRARALGVHRPKEIRYSMSVVWPPGCGAAPCRSRAEHLNTHGPVHGRETCHAPTTTQHHPPA